MDAKLLSIIIFASSLCKELENVYKCKLAMHPSAGYYLIQNRQMTCIQTTIHWLADK